MLRRRSSSGLNIRTGCRFHGHLFLEIGKCSVECAPKCRNAEYVANSPNVPNWSNTAKQTSGNFQSGIRDTPRINNGTRMSIRLREIPDILRRPSSGSAFRYTGTERTNVPANRPHTIQLCRAEQVRFRHVRAQGNGTYNNSITQWCCDIPTAVSRTQAKGATQLSRRRAPRTSLRSSFATSSGSRLAVGSAGSAASANISSSSSGVAGGGVAS